MCFVDRSQDRHNGDTLLDTEVHLVTQESHAESGPEGLQYTVTVHTRLTLVLRVVTTLNYVDELCATASGASPLPEHNGAGQYGGTYERAALSTPGLIQRHLEIPKSCCRR